MDQEPKYFLDNFDFYDNWQVENNTDAQVFIGEYSVFEHDTPSTVLNFSDPAGIHISNPSIISALGEGVYLLGAERNPNTVRLSSYAPSLANRNYLNWTPDMIEFDASPNRTVLSVSYWQQWLFSHYRGTQTLPVENTGPLNPLFWGSTIEKDGTVYLKVSTKKVNFRGQRVIECIGD